MTLPAQHDCLLPVVLALLGDAVEHRSQPRWPARQCGQLPNPGFDDSPEEYVMFFQWSYAGVAPGASLLIPPGKVQLSDTFNAGSNGRTSTGEVPPAGAFGAPVWSDIFQVGTP